MIIRKESFVYCTATAIVIVLGVEIQINKEQRTLFIKYPRRKYEGRLRKDLDKSLITEKMWQVERYRVEEIMFRNRIHAQYQPINTAQKLP